MRVTASTRIPTSIMHMFGFESLPLNVTCDASLNFVNTDVMLVLDVTGSMERECSTAARPEDRRAARRGDGALRRARADPDPARSERPAAALRRRALFEHGQCRHADPRRSTPPIIADNVDYQSRVANYNDAVYDYIAEPRAAIGAGLRRPTAAPVRLATSHPGQLRQISARTQSFSRLQPRARPSRRRPGARPRPGLATFSNNEAGRRRLGLAGLRHVAAPRAAAGASYVADRTPPTTRDRGYTVQRLRPTSRIDRRQPRSSSGGSITDRRRNTTAANADDYDGTSRRRLYDATSSPTRRRAASRDHGRPGTAASRSATRSTRSPTRRATSDPGRRLRPQHQPDPAPATHTRWRPMSPS